MVKFYSQDFLSISSAGFGHRISLALRACFERFHEFLKPVAYRKMEITVGFVFSNGKFSSITARPLLCGYFNQNKELIFQFEFRLPPILAAVLISENPGVNLQFFSASSQ